MRFIVIHGTNARWEAGEIPSRELIQRVGQLIGEMSKSKVFLGGEGLLASSRGVRLRRSGGAWTVRKGPFEGDNELPSGFTILEVESLDEAVEWASRLSEVLGDQEIDVRPVTEPWDIGLTPRPEKVTKRRYMALRKATPSSEAGTPLSPEQRAGMSRLIDEAKREGRLVVAETLRPSRLGRRYKNSRDGVHVTDGPFTESKELIAGYVILSADSTEDAARWAARYIEVVEAEEADLRELEGVWSALIG